MIILILIKALVLIIFYTSSSAAVTSYGTCVTPQNSSGLCIHIVDCSYLYSMLLSSNATIRDHLKNSQCGYDNTQSSTDRRVLVCCPDEYCKDVVTTRSGDIQPGDVLPEAGVCGSVLSNRIYGGNVTNIDEFPWLVLIEYKKPNNKYGFHCGGSLINSRYILTAAHCIINPSMPETWKIYSIRLGDWNLATEKDCDMDDCAPPALNIKVEQSIIHEKYTPGSTNQVHDIALIRMAESVEYNDFLKPVCLPVAPQLRHKTFDNSKLDVAGWGATETARSSAIKLKLAVKVWNITSCQEKYQLYNVEVDEELQLCAGGISGEDACRGDSGGSLVVEDRVGKYTINFAAGVVSFGPRPCGLKDWPGVYTRVGSYIDWIIEHIAP